MSDTDGGVSGVMLQALTGRGAHVLVVDALEGLTAEQSGARTSEGQHTVFEIVNHLVYWHDFALAWIDGGKPETPQHAAESWPGESAPSSEAEWSELCTRFADGLAGLQERARTLPLLEERGPKTVLEILQLIASHNSYHVGQIALIRRTLGAWPPPQGGATW